MKKQHGPTGDEGLDTVAMSEEKPVNPPKPSMTYQKEEKECKCMDKGGCNCSYLNKLGSSIERVKKCMVKMSAFSKTTQYNMIKRLEPIFGKNDGLKESVIRLRKMMESWEP